MAMHFYAFYDTIWVMTLCDTRTFFCLYVILNISDTTEEKLVYNKIEHIQEDTSSFPFTR